ncbi:MAG: aldose 1-epimerase [Betaproteobacteria bacterium]
MSLELVEGAARVALLPATGGAIAAFEWHGRDVLRPTPADARVAGNVRLSACYPLVPYSNRIRDALLHFRGADYPLARNFGDHPHAIHGVGWQRAWHVERASPAHALLTFTHDASGDNARAWPWPFRASHAFDLTAGERRVQLVMTLTIANIGAASFPFGLGWHPFFPRDASTTLRFDASDVWLNDATQLPLQRIPAAGRWDFASPRDPGEAMVDNLFGGWGGSAELEHPNDGMTTTLSADRACNRLVVYAPEGRAFVAIEPITHETDAFNRAGRGATDTGMRVLPPGAAFSCTMRIRAALRH